MMALITAALFAAQPAPAPAPHGQMAPMTSQQHELMKKDCCKDCCKDMDAKHADHAGEHGGHPAR